MKKELRSYQSLSKDNWGRPFNQGIDNPSPDEIIAGALQRIASMLDSEGGVASELARLNDYLRNDRNWMIDEKRKAANSGLGRQWEERRFRRALVLVIAAGLFFVGICILAGTFA